MAAKTPSGFSPPKEGDLIICETPSGTWHYHLRVVGPEGPNYGGPRGKMTALCGVNVGWDMKFPLEAWGEKSFGLERYCAACTRIFSRDPELLKKCP